MLANGKDPELEVIDIRTRTKAQPTSKSSRTLTRSYQTRYKELLEVSKSKFEKEIRKDIRRTFPTNSFFQDPEGPGQASLFNVMKAYSIND